MLVHALGIELELELGAETIDGVALLARPDQYSLPATSLTTQSIPPCRPAPVKAEQGWMDHLWEVMDCKARDWESVYHRRSEARGECQVVDTSFWTVGSG